MRSDEEREFRRVIRSLRADTARERSRINHTMVWAFLVTLCGTVALWAISKDHSSAFVCWGLMAVSAAELGTALLLPPVERAAEQLTRCDPAIVGQLFCHIDFGGIWERRVIRTALRAILRDANCERSTRWNVRARESLVKGISVTRDPNLRIAGANAISRIGDWDDVCELETLLHGGRLSIPETQAVLGAIDSIHSRVVRRVLSSKRAFELF